jgi:hypothetical protein
MCYDLEDTRSLIHQHSDSGVGAVAHKSPCVNSFNNSLSNLLGAGGTKLNKSDKIPAYRELVYSSKEDTK